MKFAKDAVLERAAISTYLQAMAEEIAERALEEKDTEGALVAGGIKGIVTLIMEGAHMDIIKEEVQQEVLPIDIQKSIVGTFKDSSDLPN